VPVSWIQELGLEYIENLSSDHKYLLDMCKAVSSGTCSQSLSNIKPGKMHHARWLTTASRLLRLYVATDNPSEALKTIVFFIVHVYAYVWFSVKYHPSIAYGSRNLWKLVSSSRIMDTSCRNNIDTVIRRGQSASVKTYRGKMTGIRFEMCAERIFHRMLQKRKTRT